MSERYHEIDLAKELNDKILRQKIVKSRQERANKFTTGGEANLIYNTISKEQGSRKQNPRSLAKKLSPKSTYASSNFAYSGLVPGYIKKKHPRRNITGIISQKRSKSTTKVNPEAHTIQPIIHSEERKSSPTKHQNENSNYKIMEPAKTVSKQSTNKQIRQRLLNFSSSNSLYPRGSSKGILELKQKRDNTTTMQQILKVDNLINEKQK